MIAALVFALRMLTPAEMQDDLRVLRQSLEATHGTLYRYTTKAEMDAAFDRVEASLGQPMSELEFFRLLLPLTDRIHDAHTLLDPNRDLLRNVGAHEKVFPLDLRFVEGRAFVEKNFSDDGTIPPGGEVIAVDGVPMAQLIEKVFEDASADGYNRTAKYAALDKRFWLAYYLAVCEHGRFEIEVRDGGTTRRHSVDGVSSQFFAAQYKVQRHDDFALDDLDANTILMTIPSFGDLALAGRFANAFHELRERRVANLIIDVRDNPGGWDELNTELFSYFIPHPFRFYKDFTFRAHDWQQLQHFTYTPDDFLNAPDLHKSNAEKKSLMDKPLPEVIQHDINTNPAIGIHQPKPDIFRGNVYMLANGASGSSGGEVAAMFHFLGIGTLIGEEPNATYQGTEGGILVPMKLPHSGMQLHVPFIAYQNAVLPGVFEGHGVTPHFVVGETVDDAIRGRDTALQFTLELIRTRAAR